jgi:hypothetical protein
MHVLRLSPTTACRRGDTDITASNRTDGSDAGRDSSAKPTHVIARIPGIRDRAPRRNALVVLLYLLVAVFLAGLFGRFAGVIPASAGLVVSKHRGQSSAGAD